MKKKKPLKNRKLKSFNNYWGSHSRIPKTITVHRMNEQFGNAKNAVDDCQGDYQIVPGPWPRSKPTDLSIFPWTKPPSKLPSSKYQNYSYTTTDVTSTGLRRRSLPRRYWGSTWQTLETANVCIRYLKAGSSCSDSKSKNKESPMFFPYFIGHLIILSHPSTSRRNLPVFPLVVSKP